MRLWAGERQKYELNHELIWAPLATAALVGALVLPFLPRLGTPCTFLRLTGHPCPSCGMTRSWEAAMRGDFPGALRWSPLGTVVFTAVAVYVPYAWAVLLLRLKPVRVSLTRRWERVAVPVVIVVLVLVNWVYVWTNGMRY